MSLQWEEVDKAKSYIAFNEIPTIDKEEEVTSPVYEGSEPELTLNDLYSGQVVRIRMIAVDDKGQVLARSLARTAAGHPDNHGDGITWVANADGFEAFLSEDAEQSKVSTYSVESANQNESKQRLVTYQSTGVEFTDDGYTGEESISYTISGAPIDPPDEHEAPESLEEEEIDEEIPTPGNWHMEAYSGGAI